MHKKSQIKNIFWEFSRIFMVQRRNLFQDSNFPKSYLPKIRGSSWHNKEIKMTSWMPVCYYGEQKLIDKSFCSQVYAYSKYQHHGRAVHVLSSFGLPQEYNRNTIYVFLLPSPLPSCAIALVHHLNKDI
jgi:hypothetical protein